MPLLSASELAAIQSVARSGMESSASILTRETLVTDDGQQSVWATSQTDVPCWIYEATPISATVGNISGGVGLAEQFSIRMPVGTEVYAGDQIGVTGKVYQVQSTNADSTYPAWLNCACRMIE
jgi:hypothetical protein